jgi:hypothetical protein
LLEGANVKLISERLGYEGVGITLKHDAHVLPSMQRQAANLVRASSRKAKQERTGGP